VNTFFADFGTTIPMYEHESFQVLNQGRLNHGMAKPDKPMRRSFHPVPPVPPCSVHGEHEPFKHPGPI